ALGAADAKAQAPAPVYSWTGFYIGGSVGYGKETTRFTDHVVSPTLTLSWTSFTGFDQPVDLKDSGVNFGFHAGYNFQVNRVVVGIETDLTYLNQKARYVWDVPSTSSGTRPGLVDSEFKCLGT